MRNPGPPPSAVRRAPTDPAPARPSAGPPRSVAIEQRRGIERRSVVIVVAVGLVGWLLIVFAGALADAAAVRDEARRELAVNEDLRARVAAGEAEIALIGERAFLDHLARAFGMGEPGERAFSLAPGAPPPPSMRPLGPTSAPGEAADGPTAWIDALLGR
jgi:cell division protein FtsB